MSIRPFAAGDVPQVAALYHKVMRYGWANAPPQIRFGSPTPPEMLARTFERYFLEYPWADPEIPSLVWEDSAGRILGFIGSSVRRLIFDGRPMRLGCSGPWLTAPEARGSGVGPMLLRRYLAGPQDVSITDGALDNVGRMWVKLGGTALGLRSLEWVKFFRPLRFATDYVLDRLALPWLKPMARTVCSPVDFLYGRARRLPHRRTCALVSEELTAAALVTHAEKVMGWLRLRPAYDGPFLDWLFTEMAAVPSRGQLSRRLVRDQAGEVLGWHISLVKPRSVAEVCQIAAKQNAFEAVLEDLFTHVRVQGATALRGRFEPQLLFSLTDRDVIVRRTSPALIHSRDRSIISAVALGEALLTRLDGEAWMGLYTERFESDPANSAKMAKACVVTE